jgi:hypothetical protein
MNSKFHNFEKLHENEQMEIFSIFIVI